MTASGWSLSAHFDAFPIHERRRHHEKKSHPRLIGWILCCVSIDSRCLCAVFSVRLSLLALIFFWRHPMARSSDIVWHDHLVDRTAREERLGQRGVVVWFTGLSGCGKSTVANELDRQLHQRGCASMLLDGDNLRHGLCSPPDRLLATHGEAFAERFWLGIHRNGSRGKYQKNRRSGLTTLFRGTDHLDCVCQSPTVGIEIGYGLRSRGTAEPAVSSKCLWILRLKSVSSVTQRGSTRRRGLVKSQISPGLAILMSHRSLPSCGSMVVGRQKPAAFAQEVVELLLDRKVIR